MTKIYLSNKNLYKEILVSKEMGKLTKEAEKMLILLADNVIKKFSYTNPMDKDDCYQESLYQLFKNWHSFNELKSVNPFAFFTEICKRGIAQGFNKVHIKKNGEYMTSKIMSIDGFYEDGRDLEI